MSKRTPGPWVNGYGQGITGPRTPCFCGPTVQDYIARRDWENDGAKGNAPSPFFSVVSVRGETVAIVPGEKLEREANARLIAAAPDLLEALRNMIEFGRTNDHEEYAAVREDAIAAIAKAEGK